MHRDFHPLFHNPHLATLAGNFWRRPRTQKVVGHRTSYRIDDRTTLVGYDQTPETEIRGRLVVLHGLEGSVDAGYIQSLADLALSLKYSVHRLNLRTCGGSEALSATMYHSGLTSDVASIIEHMANQNGAPIVLVGFSLGGNIAVKLTGEFGPRSPLVGTISISAPLDLAACVRCIDRASNQVYARRFLTRLKSRIKRKSILSPESYSVDFLNTVQSIWQFDDRYTAPLFGFGKAANYYATQSAINYVPQICSPTLLIVAKDDPLVPFHIYQHPVITKNPAVQLLAPEHGGHVGFLARHKPRFWVDSVAMEWIQSLTAA